MQFRLCKIVNLILFLAFVFFWQSFAIDTEDVHKLASEVSSLTSATWDIAPKLKHISKHAATFVRVATPIGSLIAAGAEVVFPPESDEFKAIKELQKFVTSKFAALSRHVQAHTNEIKYFLVSDDYSRSVSHALNGIERFHSKMIDPYANRSSYRAQFIERCNDRNSPHDVLIYLKERLYDNCPLPSNDEAENYAEVFDLFSQLEKNHRKNLTSVWFGYDLVKQSLLAKSSFGIVRQKLEKIVFSAKRSQNIQETLRTLHEQLFQFTDVCWLKTIFEGNEWKRDQLFHFAEVLRLDLIKASIFAANCANISNQGKPKETEEELQTIEILLSEIANHVAIWMEEKLKTSWPTISGKFASAATGNEPIQEDSAKYTSIAWKVKNVLDHMGPENFFHNVMLFPNWDDSRQFAKNCPQHFCLNIMNVNEVNVVAVRYGDTQFEKADKAFNWFDKKKQQQIVAIIEDWYDESSSQPLSSLMDRLKDDLEGFADPDLYGNVVLLRNWMFFNASATVTVGYTLTNIRGVPTQQGLVSAFDPVLFNAEHYHLHMFI
ncbi:hypothetical protein niasHT_020622 [Heterodera trifolii]|uniref:Uncharacterized protein n=1 Tax=Heterodera trifolii TaxID=157864 RepID=A0ABD2KMF1_9BILA